MSTAPALVIGLPLYGRGDHLEEALESLLGQTRRDLAIVVTDDAADPAARDVLDRFDDDRLQYRRNEERLGLVGNWRRAFEVARRLHPGAAYFAWASDHDAWHPYWAEHVLELLEREPRGVLAYPRTYRMDETGSTLPSKNWTFTTAGLESPAARVRAAVRHMSAGNMVYGIYRAEVLERAGVFRYALLPDRLLLTELSMHGHLLQVDEPLFYRRVTEAPSLERQRAAFWPSGNPAWARLPWPWQHMAILTVQLMRGGGPGDVSGVERWGLIANQAFATSRYGIRAGIGRFYYERIMRRRSLKRMARRSLGRIVEGLQARSWGRPLLRFGRRALDLAPTAAMGHRAARISRAPRGGRRRGTGP
jgi:glycosyltransferase involved in cell wall biosynthesis